MAAIQLLTGVALLTLGRKLFWLFVAGVGVIVAVRLATELLQNQPNWLIVLVAVGAALLGALLAIFLQRLAIGLAGFLAGGYLTMSLLAALGGDAGALSWVLYLIGGIVGAILLELLFDWALIGLSSLVGAALIAQSVPLEQQTTMLLFVAAFVVGVLLQAGLMTVERRRRPVESPRRSRRG